MKKYLCAQFMLELIIEEGKEPDVELRDRNGSLCCRGDVNCVVDFVNESYDQYLTSLKQSKDSNS